MLEQQRDSRSDFFGAEKMAGKQFWKHKEVAQAQTKLFKFLAPKFKLPGTQQVKGAMPNYSCTAVSFYPVEFDNLEPDWVRWGGK